MRNIGRPFVAWLYYVISPFTLSNRHPFPALLYIKQRKFPGAPERGGEASMGFTTAKPAPLRLPLTYDSAPDPLHMLETNTASSPTYPGHLIVCLSRLDHSSAINRLFNNTLF